MTLLDLKRSRITKRPEPTELFSSSRKCTLSLEICGKTFFPKNIVCLCWLKLWFSHNEFGPFCYLPYSGLSSEAIGMPCSFPYRKITPLPTIEDIKEMQPDVAANLNRLLQVLST